MKKFVTVQKGTLAVQCLEYVIVAGVMKTGMGQAVR